MNIISLSQNYASFFEVKLIDELYEFNILYNSRFGNWSFDLLKDNVEILSGVSMVLGTDLLSAYNLDIGGLFMVDLDKTNLDASAFDIGTRVVLVHATEEEINGLTI